MGNLLYDIPFIPFVLLMIAMLVASIINLKKLKQGEPQKKALVFDDVCHNVRCSCLYCCKMSS